MSKFNTTTKRSTITSNYMGGVSYKQSEKEELVFSVLTTFLDNSYYESSDKRLARIKELVHSIAEKDPHFIAKLAIVTRKEFHMRSAYHVLIGELSKNHIGDSLVKNTIVDSVERLDDLTEIVAYVKRPIPNQIKKAVRIAIKNFDTYQLSKYRGEGKAFSLRDLILLTHPKPSNEQESLWKNLLEKKLKQTDTWEAKLSSKKTSKSEAWKELLKEKKLGYMALLKNLCNIAEVGDNETIEYAINQLTNPLLVKKSKQLPFRFLSAYKALGGEGRKYDKKPSISFEKETDSKQVLQNAVEKAVMLSIDNIPTLTGRTMILTDNSGSMRGDGAGGSPVSAMSSVKTSDIANLFATMYWMKADNTYVGLFGDRLINPVLDRTKGLFENYQIIENEASRCGASTETGVFEAFEKIVKEKIIVERIVIFSDCQVGTGCKWYDTGSKRGGHIDALLKEYKKINPNVKVYSVDLKGYGNTMFADGVFSLSGWSEKIFDLMEVMEKGRNGMVKWIEEYNTNK